jgi:hypothetical protein
VATTASSTVSPVSRTGILAAPIACGCCLVAGAAYVTAVDPSDGGGFLPCPFRTLTGLWCPGCGLTRATHYLFRGDLAQALRYNVFVVLVVAAVTAGWLAWFLRLRGRPTLHRRLVPILASRTVVVGAIVTVVAFAVLRNLPGITGLRG